MRGIFMAMNESCGVKLTEELIWIISYFKTLAKYLLSRPVHIRAELSLHLVRERRGGLLYAIPRPWITKKALEYTEEKNYKLTLDREDAGSWEDLFFLSYAHATDERAEASTR